MEGSRCKIVDISWKFGVTAASSESDQIGKTFLQLRLVLDDNGNNGDVFTEMTLSQFYKFLHDLEKVEASLNLLTTEQLGSLDCRCYNPSKVVISFIHERLL